MTNYSIVQYTGRADEFFVEINTDGAITRSGPYDTEEKAKRRIRDLKRADIEQLGMGDKVVGIVPPVHVDCPKRCLPVPLHNPAIPAAITETAQITLRSVRWHGKPRNGYRPAHRANRFK